MHNIRSKLIPALFLFVAAIVLSVFLPATASASHSWGGYHWARTVNPFNLKLGDNLSSVWDPILATTSFDWSLSSVLDTTIVPGGTKARNCRATSGRVEVCNSNYGNNGWLGLAQIWVNSNLHIVQGVTKVNDTYFNTSTYNTTPWRNLVMCQEVGHTLGLDHQDVNFDNANLGSCMDYTSNPETNQHPNQHDYDELELIYAHLDASTTLSQTLLRPGQGNFNNPSEWGELVKKQGRVAVFERDFGLGNKLFTFVIYAD
ncbi:hypothetical protein HY387_00485 [Candidatus Daviesbacteria bacterium]|nr:hypothetical protein [Candidatus Daviesbacteria bacterium]